MNRKDVAQKFSDEILKQSGDEIVSITLFGSVAEGVDTINSDIDILVVTDVEQDISEPIYDIVADFVIQHAELLSILIYNINSMSSFAKKVVKEGIILYERNTGTPTKVQTLS